MWMTQNCTSLCHLIARNQWKPLTVPRGDNRLDGEKQAELQSWWVKEVKGRGGVDPYLNVDETLLPTLDEVALPLKIQILLFGTTPESWIPSCSWNPKYWWSSGVHLLKLIRQPFLDNKDPATVTHVLIRLLQCILHGALEESSDIGLRTKCGH